MSASSGSSRGFGVPITYGAFGGMVRRMVDAAERDERRRATERCLVPSGPDLVLGILNVLLTD